MSLSSRYFLQHRNKVNKTQSGVFRTNCVDCLDRTNVVQSLLASLTLHEQCVVGVKMNAFSMVACTVTSDAQTQVLIILVRSQVSPSRMMNQVPVIIHCGVPVASTSSWVKILLEPLKDFEVLTTTINHDKNIHHYFHHLYQMPFQSLKQG